MVANRPASAIVMSTTVMCSTGRFGVPDGYIRKTCPVGCENAAVAARSSGRLLAHGVQTVAALAINIARPRMQRNGVVARYLIGIERVAGCASRERGGD